MPVCLPVVSAGGAESSILSAGGAESIILSAGVAESVILSAHAESMDTLGAVWLCYYAMLSAAATKKTTIGNTDDRQLRRTLVNIASTAPTIGLPLKGAKLCHTLNILLYSGVLMPPCPIAAVF